MHGIDAPEKGQAFGNRARQALSDAVPMLTATAPRTGFQLAGHSLPGGQEILAAPRQGDDAWAGYLHAGEQRVKMFPVQPDPDTAGCRYRQRRSTVPSIGIAMTKTVAPVVFVCLCLARVLVAAQPDGNDLFLPAGDYTVARGQITFDAEGVEDQASRFHSRRLHWPEGASGVTIGRGYDMKQRSQAEVRADLIAAGIEESRADQLAKGARLSGQDAKQFVQDNRGIEITPTEQKRLFEQTYAVMEADVRRIVSKPDVVEAYGETDWEKLNPAIRDVVVDLRFRGDYSPATRKLIQSLVAANDLQGLIKAMGDPGKWKNVPFDRFRRRLNFLREAAGLPPERVSIGFDDSAPKKK